MRKLALLILILWLSVNAAVADQIFSTGGSGGGGGTPGGSDKQIQYNNTGAFGGISNGSAGQVLTSNGAGSAPSFQAVAGGGGTSPFCLNNDVDITQLDNYSCTDAKVDPSGTYIYAIGRASDTHYYLNRVKIADGTVTNLDLGTTAQSHIAITPDGALAFTFHTNTTVKKITLSTFTIASTITLNFAPNNILAYDVSPDSSTLVFGSGSGGTAKVLEINTSTNAETDVNISGHSVSSNVKCICFYLQSNSNLAIQGTGNIDIVDTSGTYASTITADNQYIQLRSGSAADTFLCGLANGNNVCTVFRGSVKQQSFFLNPYAQDLYYLNNGDDNGTPSFMCLTAAGPVVFGAYNQGWVFQQKGSYPFFGGICGYLTYTGPVPNTNDGSGGYCCYAAMTNRIIQFSKVELLSDFSQAYKRSIANGSTSGTVETIAVANTPLFKKTMFVFNNYQTAGISGISFPVSFTTVNGVASNPLALTVTALDLSSISVDTTTGASTGILTVEGY